MCLDIYIKQKDNEEFLIDKKRLNLENVFSLSDIENLYSTFELSKPLWKIKVNDTQIETLIMLNYFAEFGNNNKLLEENNVDTVVVGSYLAKRRTFQKNIDSLLMQILLMLLVIKQIFAGKN